VTLTQILDGNNHVVSNAIAGSLVLNTATNTVTFVAPDTGLVLSSSISSSRRRG
jgi:hypothetical protein